MKKITAEELNSYLKKNSSRKEKLVLRETLLENMEITGLDFSGVDFSWSDFKNSSFKNCCFDYAVLNNISCKNVDFSGSLFRYASLLSADFRDCCLKKSNFEGANFTSALLSGANLEGIKINKDTVNFKNRCPKYCYFYGYKKCFNNRLVKLLIPKDAKCSSATTTACRCDKAKVVAITNLDGSGNYHEAVSFVDENFVYRLGSMVYADAYNEDRWLESSNGIHFWLTKDEALGYM